LVKNVKFQELHTTAFSTHPSCHLFDIALRWSAVVLNMLFSIDISPRNQRYEVSRVGFPVWHSPGVKKVVENRVETFKTR